jgi:hypothetical protein
MRQLFEVSRGNIKSVVPVNDRQTGRLMNMKRLTRTTSFMAVCGILLVLGCGGGGGGGTTGGGSTQPTEAVVKIAMTGTLPAGTLIGGIDIAVSLARGVSAKSTSNPPETDAGVVVASGVASTNSQILATYTPPSGSTHGTARLLVINASGFGTGEFATVSGDIAEGYNPTSADFTVNALTVADLNGAPLSGLTAVFTVSNQ